MYFYLFPIISSVWPQACLAAVVLIFTFFFRSETLQGQQEGKRWTKRRRKVEEKAKRITIVEKREHKSMEGSADRAEKDKKSLVSLVSSTRLKGQMESQWGSLSGSHYWNRKFFFSFYIHTKSVLEAASFKGFLSFFSFQTSETCQCVCIHAAADTQTPMLRQRIVKRGRWLKCGGGVCVCVCRRHSSLNSLILTWNETAFTS